MKKLFILIGILLAPLLLRAQEIEGNPPYILDRAISVWARNRVNANYTAIFGEVDSLRDGSASFTSISLTGDLNIIGSYAGLLGTKVTNTYSGAAVVAGAVHQLTNDLGYWSLIGMTNSGSTILGGAFINTFHVYNQGYANTLFTVDGNKDFVWYSDPTDAHDFTALTNPIMTLSAGGKLTVDTVHTDSLKTRVLDYDPPHGAMNFADSTTVIALTQNVWTKVTGPAGDLFVVRDQSDLTIAGDSITIAIPGDYLLWVSFSFDGINAAVFHIAVYKNGVVTDWEMHRRTSAQDTGNMGMPTYLKDLVAGDDISLWIENTGNDGDATMVSGQVVITMLHPD